MFLKYIYEYENEKRLKLCESLACFAAIDGSIDEKEKNVIKAIYQDADLHGELANIDYESMLSMPKEDIEDKIMKHFYSKNLKKSEKKMIMFELLSIAFANGVYDKAEKGLMDSILESETIEEDIFLEIEDIIKTILILNKKADSIVFSEVL